MSICILGIDPGTSYTGTALIHLDENSFKIVGIETVLIDVQGLPHYSLTGTSLQMRLAQISKHIYTLLSLYSPLITVLEYGFMNRLRPSAYGPLSQIRGVIEHTVYLANNNPHKKNTTHLTGLPPSIIKKGVNVSGGSGKQPVLDSVSSIPEITQHINPKVLTQDEVDAIAIAYTMVGYIRQYPHILLI